jgi:hypothetical protein
MTQFLPPNLLALFAPRDPIPYLPPLEKLPHEKHHNQPYCGIAPYIREFEVSSLSRIKVAGILGSRELDWGVKLLAISSCVMYIGDLFFLILSDIFY